MFTYESSKALRMFIDELPKQCALLQAALAAKEINATARSELKTMAHRVRGGAGIFGFGKLSEIAAKLELLLGADAGKFQDVAGQFLTEARHVLTTAVPGQK